MKAFFINPPFLKKFSRPQRSPAVTKSNTMYYPLMLSQAAANMKYMKGTEVELIDACAKSIGIDQVLSYIPESDQNIAIIETSTPSIDNDIEFANLLKEKKGIRTFLTGTHVSVLEGNILEKSSADAILKGEWDKTALSLLDKNASRTRGMIYRDSSGIIDTGEPDIFEDLDSLPFVSRIYRDFLNIRDYFNPNARFPMVTISSSRGCPYKCRFCLYPQTFYKSRIRRRSIGNILDEVDFILKELKPNSLFFEDDCFTYDKDFVYGFCTEILRRYKKPFLWTANSRADLDFELLSLMKKAGLTVLCVGYESGNQKVLDWMQKKLTVENMIDFSRSARKAGVLVHGCFMLGAPFEDRDSLKMTLDLALKLNPDTIQVYPIIVYPGTDIYNEYERLNLLNYESYRDWLTEEGLLSTTIRTRYLTSTELVDYAYYFRKKFYFRPRYIIKKGANTLLHPGEISRTFKAFKAFIRFISQ